jgi:molybdopterin converting factor small subunit
MKKTVTLDIAVFGQCQALIGEPTVSVQVNPPITAAGVITALCRQYPQLAPLEGNLLVAVNEEYATADTLIRVGDEVAVFPPIAGG